MKLEKTADSEWLLREGARPLAFIREHLGIYWICGADTGGEPIGFRRLVDALRALDPDWLERERKEQERPIFRRGVLTRRRLRRD